MCFTKQPGGLEYSRVKRHLGLVRYATPISSITGVVTLRAVTGTPEAINIHSARCQDEGAL